MKATTQALRDNLYLLNVHRVADLVTIEVASGTLRWTSYDASVEHGGNTWTAAPVISRPRSHHELGLVVDSITVDIATGPTVGGAPIVKAAIRGDFRGVRLLAERAFLNSAGAVLGVEDLFDGNVVDVEPSSAKIRLTAKSVLARFDTVLPARVVQPGCPLQVYSAACGAVMASFTTAATVAAGSSTTVVKLAAGTANATVSGWLHFSTGALAGARATVVEVVSSSEVRVAVPLPSAPAEGDAVSVIRGCDKTRTTCASVFNRKEAYGGFPDAPPPEAADG